MSRNYKMHEDAEFSGSDEVLTRAKINAETARIAWRDLQRYFAGGYAIAVEPDLNLLDVASAFAADDRDSVASWIEQGRMGKVSDQQAMVWHDANALVCSVVVKP